MLTESDMDLIALGLTFSLYAFSVGFTVVMLILYAIRGEIDHD